jgi:hypothetical protein
MAAMSERLSSMRVPFSTIDSQDFDLPLRPASTSSDMPWNLRARCTLWPMPSSMLGFISDLAREW